MFLDNIPRAASGKVLRKKLKDMAAKELEAARPIAATAVRVRSTTPRPVRKAFWSGYNRGLFLTYLGVLFVMAFSIRLLPIGWNS